MAADHSMSVVSPVVRATELIMFPSPITLLCHKLCQCRLCVLFPNVTQTIKRLNVAPKHSIPHPERPAGGPFNKDKSRMITYTTIILFIASSFKFCCGFFILILSPRPVKLFEKQQKEKSDLSLSHLYSILNFPKV